MKKLQGVRIARVATVPYFVISQLREQLESLCDAGAQVVVVTSPGPGLASLEARGIMCLPVEISRAPSPWKDLVAVFKLFIIFWHGNFDIAHSTTPKAGLLTAIAAFLARVPIRLHTFTGQPWVTMQRPVYWFARWSDWVIGRLNTRCYADSETQRQFLIEHGIIDPARLLVIGNGSLAGVNLDRFNSVRFSASMRAKTRETLGITPEVQVVLFVGRITIDKGVRELIAAFLALKKRGSEAHLIFVGPFDSGSNSNGEICREDIVGVPDTHLVGYTENPEAYMAIADVLCLPSYREGFGTVVIEAAAMGIPTVGTKIPGLLDAVSHGKTGVLVAVRDAYALANALSDLLENKELCAKMGRAARERAELLFDSRSVNGQAVTEYRKLLNTDISVVAPI